MIKHIQWNSACLTLVLYRYRLLYFKVRLLHCMSCSKICDPREDRKLWTQQEMFLFDITRGRNAGFIGKPYPKTIDLWSLYHWKTLTDHICKIFISYLSPSETELLLDTCPSQAPVTSASISSAFTSINSSMNFESLEICCAYRVIKDQLSLTCCLFISFIKIPLPLVSDRKESIWELRGISRRQKKTFRL